MWYHMLIYFDSITISYWLKFLRNRSIVLLGYWLSDRLIGWLIGASMSSCYHHYLCLVLGSSKLFFSPQYSLIPFEQFVKIVTTKLTQWMFSLFQIGISFFDKDQIMSLTFLSSFLIAQNTWWYKKLSIKFYLSISKCYR